MTWENRLTFEVSSADPDADTPVWVDLTSRIRDSVQPVEVAIGRQNDLDSAEPATATLLLDNADDALSFGNTASPYPWWGPGRRCRLRERIGATVLDVLTGYVQTPTEGLVTAGVEQRVAVSVTDRLGRLASAPRFVSTLAAHIISKGGSALRGYWPCLDAGVIYPNIGRGEFPPILDNPGLSVSGYIPTAGASSLEGNAAPFVLADDVAPAQLSAATGTSAGLGVVALAPDLRVASTATPIPAGTIVTMVGWYYPQLPSNKNAAYLIGFVDSYGGPYLRTNSTDGMVRLTQTGTLSTVIDGRPLPDQAWVPIAIRYGWDTALIELWIGRDKYPGTLAGTPGGSNTLFDMDIATFYAGGLAHVQLYFGSATDFTFADFVAQYEMAQFGLERQTTGERVRTVAGYAGVRGYEMAVDTGSSVMQKARLAGQTPLDAMRDAERTEQGLLHTAAGDLVFKGRPRLYNI